MIWRCYIQISLTITCFFTKYTAMKIESQHKNFDLGGGSENFFGSCPPTGSLHIAQNTRILTIIIKILIIKQTTCYMHLQEIKNDA